MLNIMITAGGTDEPIDSVRKITNSSTGRLAAKIQASWLNYAQRTGCPLMIHYVAAQGAVMPESMTLTELYRISDTFSLQQTVRDILATNDIDIIIHLMAVSDYHVADVISVDDLADCLAHHLLKRTSGGVEITPEIIKGFLAEMPEINDVRDGKISSDTDLILRLSRTPKIIREMKELSPGSRLIGFKLLSNVSEEQLVQVAERQRMVCNCEFVVANDLAGIHGDRHEAVFVRDGQVFERCITKDEIAEKLVKELTS